MGAKQKLHEYFMSHVGCEIDRATLREVAGNIEDWQRSLRQLRQETGLDIEATKDGYILRCATPTKVPKKRGAVDAKLRYAVLQRDGSVCQRCGRGISDGVKLCVDHKLPVEMGGDTTIDNLWTLCEECNGGKKSFFDDADADLMKKIASCRGAANRLKLYFDAKPGIVIDPVKLQIVAGIRDWERTLRRLRSESGMNIRYIRPDSENPLGGYVYIK